MTMNVARVRGMRARGCEDWEGGNARRRGNFVARRDAIEAIQR